MPWVSTSTWRLRPPIFLPASKPTVLPPCSAPLTLWLSRIAAVGEGFRPAATRTFTRKQSLSSSQRPLLRQAEKESKTVDLGGKSLGNMLH